MSDSGQQTQTQRFVYDPDTQPDLFADILSKRIIAFVIDAVLIFLLMIPVAYTTGGDFVPSPRRPVDDMIVWNGLSP